jgi:hypothetical protein
MKGTYKNSMYQSINMGTKLLPQLETVDNFKFYSNKRIIKHKFKTGDKNNVFNLILNN